MRFARRPAAWRRVVARCARPAADIVPVPKAGSIIAIISGPIAPA
jgi:hypothetical protein